MDSTEQVGLNCSYLQRSRCGDFFQAHFLDKAQDEDLALLWRELFNHRPDAGHFLAPNKHPLLGGMGVRQPLPEVLNLLG